MALTPSTMLPLGTAAPLFSLPNVDGRLVSLGDLAEAKSLVVMFLCNHCPYVKHIRAGLVQIARDYAGKPVAFVGISANDAETHPEDGPDKMRLEAATAGYSFPYLYDATQEVAKAYRAACTPDFFVFDHERKLAYRGQFDASRPGNGLPVSGADVRAAVDALLAGRSVAAVQTPSIGCNIKWKAGNEPSYYRM